MVGTGPYVLGIALAILATANTASSEAKCPTGCHGVTPNLFKFAEGTTYKYNLDGKFEIQVSSAEGQVSSTGLKATVLLTQLPQCMQVLRLQNVVVYGTDGKEYKNIPNIEKPIRLNFHDGHVEDTICAEKGDTQVSLNIKRAVASMFQANVKKEYETDVFGVCPTDVDAKKDGLFVILTKHKNLNKCAHRENIRESFMATAYNFDSELKTSPVLSSDYKAVQKIKSGILDDVTITEHYLYVPFSIGESGAKATVTTSIKFAGQSKENPKNTCSEPKTILFENPHPTPTEKPNANALIEALRKALTTVTNVVSEHTASEYINVVQIMRASSKTDLLRAYDEVKKGASFQNKKVAHQFYIDALIKAGTGEAVEVTLTLLKQKEIPCKYTEKTALMGLGFVRHATPGSVAAATELLDNKEVDREAFLGVGALAGVYCRQHPGCQNEPAIKNLIKKYISKFGDGKIANKKQEVELVYILKSIKNLGFVDDALAAKVVQVATNKNTASRLRVAALEAYLGDSCNNKFRDSAINIMKDSQQDSEIRIKAYLAAVECPNGKVAAAVKKVLEDEPKSVQVNGYITSHLKNVRASTNPDKALAKQQLGGIQLSSTYPIDFRRFSHNFEFSNTMDTLGIASTTEADLIFSQTGFLPRSTSLNLTADVFGHRYNFLEITTRQENLEKLMEYYFGPQGLMSNKEEYSEHLEEYKNAFKQRLQTLGLNRHKRDVPKAEIEKIGKDVTIKTNELNKDLDFDLSIKMFGSEVFYESFIEKHDQKSAIDSLNKVFDEVDEAIHKAKKFENTFHYNNLFLDAELAYPTAFGFPLKITIDGASSTHLQSSGSIDIMAILGDHDNVAELSLIPSVTVEIEGKLSVDAYFVENGLKTASTLHSSTSGAVVLELFSDKKKGMDLKYSIPLQKQELISANHEIFLSSRELGQTEVDTALKFPQTKDFEVCADQLSAFVGLTFCAKINRPGNAEGVTLPFPLDGHTKFGITIKNDDLKTFHYRDSVIKDEHVFKYEESFEVVGTRGTKMRFEDVISLAPEKFFKFDFVATGLKAAGVEGKLVDTDTEKSVFLAYHLDDQKAHAKAGFKISNGGKVLTPILDYAHPLLEGDPIRLDGRILVANTPESHTFTLDNLRVISPQGATTVYTGKFGQNKETFFADVKAVEGNHFGTFKSHLTLGPEIKLDAELINNYDENSNFKLDYSLSQLQGKVAYDSKLELVHGKDLKSKVNKLTAHNALMAEFGEYEELKSFSCKNELSYPAAEVAFVLNFGESEKSLDYHVDVKYHDLTYGSKFDFKWDQKVDDDYDLEFIIHGGESFLKAIGKRVIKGDKSDIVHSLELNKKKYELKGTITHIDTVDLTNYSGDIVIKVPTYNEPFKVGYGFVMKPTNFDYHLKILQGSVVLVDEALKADHSGNANGHVKINLKGVFVANGQLKAVNGKGTSNLLLDFVKSGRKIKYDSSYTVADPIFNIDATLFTDFEKDNSKKYVVSSHNKVTEKTFDSQHSYEYQGKKFETNAKGAFDGDFYDGKQKLEAEVIFPNELYLAGKLNREMHMSEDEVINGHSSLFFEQRTNKNTPGLKFTLKANAKDTDVAEDIYDVEYDLAIDDSHGKNLNGDFSFKRKPQGEDKWLVDLKYKLYGSVMPNTFEGSTHSVYTEEVGDYKVNVKYGPKNSLDISGKYDLEGDSRPLSGDIDVVLHTSSPHLAVFKYHYAGSLGFGLKEDNIFEAVASTSIFIDDEGSPTETTLDLKYDGYLSVGEKESEVKSSVKFQHEDPISVSGKYYYDEDEEKKTVKSHGTTSITYAKDKTLKCDFNYDEPNEHEFNLDAKVLTPVENARNTRILWHVKTSEEDDKLNSDFTITADGKVYQITSFLDGDDHTPSFSVVARRPDGKTYEISSKLRRSTQTNFAGDFKLVYPVNDFVLTSSVDTTFHNIDDFSIKINVDCPAMKLDKVVFEALNKGGKGGKKIQFTAKSADKNVLSGSTNYKTREEAGKFTMEGSGSFKVGDETKSANFKFSRQELNNEQHGEEGTDISFDATLGNQAIDAEYKLTNKHFRFLESYCEEKKQCAHFEIDSKLNSESEKLDHVLEVNIDLRKLGLTHEFGLKSVTKIEGYIFDHTVDVHFQSDDKSKYQYSMFLHPQSAGASLTTPKRIIALDSTVETIDKPEHKSFQFKTYFFMDKKNRPNEKTAFYVWGENLIQGADRTSKSGAKFSTPGLGKDLVVDYVSRSRGDHFDGTYVYDIFAKPNQKLVVKTSGSVTPEGIVAIASAKSEGLKIDVNAEEKLLYNKQNHHTHYMYSVHYTFDKIKFNNLVEFQYNDKEIKGIFKVLDRDLFKFDVVPDTTKMDFATTTTYQFYKTKPVVVRAELDGNVLRFTIYRKEAPNDKIIVSAEFIPDKLAYIKSELIKGGKKVDLSHATVKLDPNNFMKMDYGVKAEEVNNALVKPIKDDFIKVTEGQKEFTDALTQLYATYFHQLADINAKNGPNFQPAKEYYAGELHKVKEEMVSDKTLKDATDFFNNVFGAAFQTISEILTKYFEFNEKVMASIQASIVRITEAFDKEFVPKLKVLEDQVGALFAEVFDVTSNTFFTFVAKITDFIQMHQADLEGVVASVASVVTEVAQAVYAVVQDAVLSVTRQVEIIVHEVTSNQYFNQTMEMIYGFTSDSHYGEILLNFINELKAYSDTVDNEYVKRFVTDLADYLQKKLNKEPVDDYKALDRLLRGIAVIVSDIFEGFNLEGPSNHGGKPHGVHMGHFSKVPKVVGTQLSAVNHLIEEEDDLQPEQILYNVAFNPHLWIPPLQLQAIIVQGQHIFTFDGKHLTFPGSCNYLLARDAVNGKFTIAGTYTNGFLTAITMSDKTDSITIKNNGQASYNNQPTDYPVIKGTIKATKEYSYIKLKTKYGAKIICDFELKGCAFYISGFYHGRIRGLLGNGNSEPADDFTLPNGKIVTSESDFGNAYKMGAGCKDIKTVDHKQHTHNKQCTKYFASEESELEDCFEFVPPGIFRTACDHGMAANVKDTVSNIVAAYATACNNRGIVLDIPDEFLKCTNGDKVRAIDESFSVKLPGKAADVVFVIDESKQNEVLFKELIPAIIADMNKEFASKKINDIEYHFIGYGGEENHRPYHYTVGGKFTTKGKLPNIKFTDEANQTSVETLLSIFGYHVQARAYEAAIKYPFRAHAVKAVFAVTGKPCQNTPFVDEDFLELIRQIRVRFFKDHQTNINLITPFEAEEFSCKDAKTTGSVIGFDADNVFTFADAKKKPYGTETLHKEIKYEDYCVDYTLEKGGNVFVTNNFLSAKGPQRKTFANIIAQNAINKMVSKGSSRTSCECERVNFYSAKNVC